MTRPSSPIPEPEGPRPDAVPPELEPALRESQRKLLTLLGNLPGMAYRCLNDQNWTMEFISEGCFPLTGYQATDLIGNRTLSYNQLILAEDQVGVWDVIQAALAQRRSFCLNYRIRHASGAVRWVWEQGTGVFSEGGELLALEGFVTDVTAQKEAEAALQRVQGELEQRVTQRTAELAALNEELRGEQQLLRRLLELLEQERQLVAYDIHDGLAQQLSGISFHLQAFRQLWERTPDEAWKEFEAGLRLVDQSLVEARRLIGGLRPPVLEKSGIVAALELLVQEKQLATGVEIQLHTNVGSRRFLSPLEVAVFRIAQESLTNALRHSQSDEIRVELFVEKDQLRIEVLDWGVGFVAEQPRAGHFGLEGIRQRARLTGGHATVDSTPGQGTRIRVCLPLAASDSRDP